MQHVTFYTAKRQYSVQISLNVGGSFLTIVAARLASHVRQPEIVLNDRANCLNSLSFLAFGRQSRHLSHMPSHQLCLDR